MVNYICTKDVAHNGIHYRKGQAWDGDLPAPQVGEDWAILQVNEAEGPRDGIAVSASRGFVQWAPQPGRIQPASLTPPEKAILAENPYANLDGPAAAAPPPSTRDPLDREKKKPAPVMSSHLLMTEEERDDPYGLKAKASATTAELRMEIEDENPPGVPPKK